jgi:uncharacterized protein YjdB
MNTLLKNLSILLVAAFTAFSCKEPVQEVPVTIHLNKELMSSLSVGSSQTLVATLSPKDAVATIVWSSDNESVAVVNEEGEVTGVAPGSAIVTAAVGEEKATCKVVVTAAKATAIEINPSKLKLEQGAQATLEVIATPAGAAVEDLEWSAKDKNIVTVVDGVVTAVGVGKSTITVISHKGDLAAVCQVEVVKKESTDPDPENPDPENPDPENPDPEDPNPEDPDPEDPDPEDPDAPALESVAIVVDGDATDLQVGLKLQLRAVFTPANAKPESVSWVISENAEAATLTQDGVIEGLHAVKGSDNNWSNVVVTVYADDLSNSKQIRVIPRQPESIEVDLPQSGWLRVGEEWDFNPRVLPEGLGYGVTCSIMRPGNNFTADARVSSDLPGDINAQFAVANNENLVYAAYRKNVVISVLPYWVGSVTLPAEQEMEVGGSIILSPEFTSDVEGVQPTYKDLRWTSSDETKAVVDDKGKVTALASGTVVITATTSSDWSVPSGQSHKSATCTVTITEAQFDVKVGDFYYSDGTTSSTLQAGKTVIGIVISRDNATSTDKKLPADCTHGVVLTLGEGYGMWSSSYDAGRVSSWATQNGYENTTGTYYSNAQWAYVRNEYGNKLLGYNNTTAMKAYMENNGYTSGILDALAACQVDLPETASELYIPSIAEMDAIAKNFEVINAAIRAAGGTEFVMDAKDNQNDAYWTSSENEASSGNAATVNPFTGELHGGAMKSKEKKVRFIFAF